jgi:hypothetical protein
MSVFCSKAPENKKEYLTDIGKILVEEHGKKKYYKPEEVREAHRKSKWYDGLESLDFSCWAMSTYSSHSEFDEYHLQTGESCDYLEMKSQMLGGLSNIDFDLSLTDVDDLSWLDFGDIFEGFFDFVTGVFD